MLFLYENMCNEEDIVSRMYEWSGDKYEKLYYKNCPILPHSHVDAKYVIANGIVPSNTKFYGIVREPLERVLSLYLYRIRDGAYGRVLPSPEHFQSLFNDGIFIDTPQQIQAQSTFLTDTGIYWLYENVENHLKELCVSNNITVTSPLQLLNKSPGNTKKLINHFYTEDLISKIKRAYDKDFILYEKLKKQYPLENANVFIK